MLTVKISDGSVLNYVEFGTSGLLPQSIAVSSLDRLAINGQTATGSFRKGTKKEVFIMYWDWLMGDSSCSIFDFKYTDTATAYSITGTPTSMKAVTFIYYDINLDAIVTTANA